MKKLCKAAAAFLAVGMTLSMASCAQGGPSSASSTGSAASNASVAQTSVDKIKAKGSITVSLNAEFAPFEYMEGQDIKGIDIEISKKIAQKLGVTLNINNTAFDSLPTELDSGKCDFVASGMSYTEDRAKNMDFSKTYFNASQAIIVMKNSAIKTPADLAGKKIGVQLGTTGDTYCTEKVSNAQVERLSKAVDAVSDMMRGSLDAVVIDDYPAQKLVAANADKVVKLNDALTVETYSIAVKKGNKELVTVIDEVLSEMEKSGELQKILDQYIGSEK